MVRPDQRRDFKARPVGPAPVSLQAGAGWWAETPDAGPEGLRLRFQANFMLPKK